jgi:hypothetical protein
MIIWQHIWRWQFQFHDNRCLESVCLVPAFFDDEYVVDPDVVKLHSKTKSSVKGHMFGLHLVEVRCVTKSSNKGHMFGPHFLEVRSETKSSVEGHILDHIWSKSSVRQSPLTRCTYWTTFGQSALRDKALQQGAYVGPHLVKVCSETKSPDKGHIVDHIWSSLLRDKVLQQGAQFGPHLVEVRCVTKSANEGHNLDHIWWKSAVRQSPPTRGIIFCHI